MIHVVCKKCGHEQLADKNMEGLTVHCDECDADIRVRAEPIESSKPEKQYTPVMVEEVTTKDLVRSVGLVVGLVVLVVVIFGLIIWGISLTKKTTPPTATTAASQPTRETVERERQTAEARESASEEAEERERRMQRLARQAEGLVWVAVFMVMVTVYTCAVFYMGWWVTKDAMARGMPGLGWMATYYFFQFTGVVLVVPPATLLAFIPVVGWVTGGLLGLGISWNGLLIYMFVRREGRLGTCGACKGKRLDYLVQCPHCGRPNTKPSEVA